MAQETKMTEIIINVSDQSIKDQDVKIVSLPIRGLVFCIGFQKTGITSLQKALQILGYDCHGSVNTDKRETIWEKRRFALERLETLVRYGHDAFWDQPWPMLFKKIDETYLDCKFIFTVRELKDWLKSAINHYKDREDPFFEWMYGSKSIQNDPDKFSKAYENHAIDIFIYFHQKERILNQLLILDICSGEGWEKLCPFLDKPIPDRSFPHLNKSSYGP